jgi:signal transduction histidine kinase/DNA-binding LacI/PurR family transcriptional regulator
MKKKSKTRPTIGLLIDNIVCTGEYQTIIWYGSTVTSRKRDVNLICFIGGSLRFSPDNKFEFQRNVIYDLVTTNNVDSLLITETLSSFITPREFHNFCRRYLPLPIVGIKVHLKGAHSVFVDDKRIRDVINHLIEVHKYNRIAFIRGPETETAITQYQAYIDALAGHDIAFNPELVATGNYLPPSGAEAVSLFLDERKLRPGKDFEAIVAANDNMALGAIEALKARGIQVPADVAVTGLDDIEGARASIPSLTTIKQPIYEMARQAIDVAISLLEGQEVPDQVMLPTAELILRRSCGCFYENTLPFIEIGSPEKGLEDVLSKQRENIITDMASALGHSIACQEISFNFSAKLLDAFSFILNNRETPDNLLQIVGKVLQEALKQGLGTASLYRAISVLRRYVQPYFKGETLSRAVVFWQWIWSLIGEKEKQEQERRRIWARQQVEALRHVSQTLVAPFEMKELMNVIVRELPRLGIKQFYISLYEQGPESAGLKQEAPTEWSRLILAYNERGRIELKEGGMRFPTLKLVPDGFLSQEIPHTLLVDSLYFRNEQFGFIVFEVGPLDGIIYSTMCMQISAALKCAFLFKDLKKTEEELTRSNSDLEQFAYIASHDLQEPLRMVRSYLQLLERRYKGQLGEDADEFISFAADGAARMQDLIKDLLKYSRIQKKGKPFKPVDLNEVFKNVLFNLEDAIREDCAVVTCDDLPTVMGNGTQLIQLFQGLVVNAIKFHRVGVSPEIHVGVKLKANTWVFSVSDNGIGIAREHYDRIFMIFQGLHEQKEHKGTGIGLALCKKIVKLHGGRIWVESKPNHGSTFYFTIPVCD